MSHDVIFLFGAGASVEAGVPTSDKITEIMLNYGSYCPSEKGIAIENLLKYIQVRIADSLQIKTSNVNFEYLLGTLIELSRLNKSPMVSLLGDIDKFIKKFEDKISLNEVIDEMYALLRELLLTNHSVGYLYNLKYFLDSVIPLDIFTLNYDLSLETAFKELGIPYTTGYSNDDGGFSVWAPSEFERKDSFDIRIFKLHGSLDWGTFFDIKPSSNKAELAQDIIYSTTDYIRKYPKRMTFDPLQPNMVKHPYCENGLVSIMNFGTHKELLYVSSQFNLLFNYFANSLQNAKICIIAGYSFRDDRINDTILETVIARKGELQLIIVDPFADSIVQNDPRLNALRRSKWITSLNISFGEALTGGELLKSIGIDSEVIDIFDVFQKDSQLTNGRSDHPFNNVIKSLKILNININLTYFRMQCILPSINRILNMDASVDSKADQIGQTLLPLIRKVRDLCYYIHKVYEHILGEYNPNDFQYFTYGEDYINSINLIPEHANGYIAEIPPELPDSLNEEISSLFYTFDRKFRELELELSNPNSGYRVYISPKPPYLPFTLFTYDTKDNIYKILSILNKIYIQLGFREPFEMICNHQEKQQLIDNPD